MSVLTPLAELVSTVQFLHQKGWAPATSSNYSVRHPLDPNQYWISMSGIDKAQFGLQHLMLIDATGRAIAPADAWPSAETLLHTMLYRLYPDVHCVLHTHTIFNSVLSYEHQYDRRLRLPKFELLKGIPGVGTHEAEIYIPVFANSQDIAQLADKVEVVLKQGTEAPALLLAGHGLYSWGASVAEAKRVIETLEFLFESMYRLKAYMPPE
jgi:methylthioribulose-1-phosphate dehydratase